MYWCGGRSHSHSLCVWESNFWGRFISCEFVHLEVVHWMGYWCAACVTQSFFLLPLILFSFAIFNLFFFWVVSPLLFVSEETENAHVQDSTSPLPFCALKFTRSLLTSLTLAFNSMANLFISLAFEWIMVKFHQGSHKVTLCFLFDWAYISYVKSSFGIFALHCIWGYLGICLFQYELVRVQ